MKQQTKKQHPGKKAKKPVVNKQVKAAPAAAAAPLVNDTDKVEKVKKPKEPKKNEEGKLFTEKPYCVYTVISDAVTLMAFLMREAVALIILHMPE